MLVVLDLVAAIIMQVVVLVLVVTDMVESLQHQLVSLEKVVMA